jgi:molecular chaperone GrpE (heat shock protein)
MQETLPPRVPKWPFYFSAAILLATAYFIVWQGTLPPGRWEILTCLICIPLGVGVVVLPFVLEYKAVVNQIEAATLAGSLGQIKHAETIADRIAQATDNWQAVHEQSGKTTSAAREIADRMAAEVRDFTQFMQRTNDAEKATLRLEVEKLRRGEGEWVQLVVRMLDHTFALYCAGVRSGQPRLIEQLTQFQNACRDVARRTGLVPFVVMPGEPFDAQRHQTPDGKSPPAEAKVRETVATGFTFQGQLIRPAMVLIEVAATGAEGEMPPAGSEPAASPP